MKTLLTREFTRNFSTHRTQPCLVKDRGRVVGTWTPAMDHPEPIDFAARARKDFKKKLPFTFADLLKEGKKRWSMLIRAFSARFMAGMATPLSANDL
jgi:hypothetical protein